MLLRAVTVSIAEYILLLRVKVVYPGNRYLFYIGLLLILVRMVADFIGRFYYAYLNTTNIYYVVPGLVLECFNNILFTGWFIYRIRQLSESDVFKSSLVYMVWIAVDLLFLPTAASLATSILGLCGDVAEG